MGGVKAIFAFAGNVFIAPASFFQNTYLAPGSGGEVTVAPTLPGDLALIEMTSDQLMLQSGSYVASETSVEVDASWGGAKTFFASEGVFQFAAPNWGPLPLRLVMTSNGDSNQALAVAADLGIEV